MNAVQTLCPKRSTFRPELQALRAVAVAIVILYHAWPERLPGGFVGVDVFFVLSGFLITSHLVRDLEVTGRLSLRSFWERRIRRLLPAAFVVLAATAALLLLAPQAVWIQTLSEIRASALYVENWLLALSSVDYLAAENDPSLVQHYWSLSVEEQFYLVWPVILLAAAMIAAKTGRRVLRIVLLTMVALAACSLIYSIHLTTALPELAYFVTPTRVWEFALGGILAMLPGLSEWVMRRLPLRIALSWVGLAMIVGSAVLFTNALPFPGVVAAVPVFGTLMVIVAGQVDSPLAPTFYGRLRPIQWLGDVSYSAYLWHWPLLVVAAGLVGHFGAVQKAIVIAATFVLAALTKRFVEDPVRTGVRWRSSRRMWLLLISGMTVLVLGTTAAIVAIEARQSVTAQERDRLASCIGAAPSATGADCEGVVSDDAVFPELIGLVDDHADQYRCFINERQPMQSCTYGPDGAEHSIALIGDSHAAAILPGLLAAADDLDAQVTTFVGFGCRLGYADGCIASADIESAVSAGSFDVVLVTGTRRFQPGVESLVASLGDWISRGLPIVPVVDVPVVAESTLACLDRSGGEYPRILECSTPRDEALERLPDSYGPAAELLGIDSIDLTNEFCGDDTCPAAINHAIVYRDPASHLTTTFSASLRWAIAAQLAPLLE